MKTPNILKGTRAQGGAVSFFIGAMIAVVLGLSVAWPVMDSAINSGSGAYATLTLTGNSSCGQLINVTNAAGTKVTFQLNITGVNQGYCALPLTTPYDVVQIKENWNTSTVTALNLTTNMNANASISGTMTAVSGGAGKIVLQYNTHGSAGNLAGVVLAETLANGAWSGTTLSGGVSDATTMPSAAGTLVDQLPLFLILVLLMVFVRTLI